MDEDAQTKYLIKIGGSDVPTEFLVSLREELVGETGEKVMGKQTLFRMVEELLDRRREAASPLPQPSQEPS